MSAQISRTLLERNGTYAVLTGFAQTDLRLEGCLVRDTLLSDEGQYGLGLLSGWGTQVLAGWSAFRGNQTVGVVAFSESTLVTLHNCEVSGTLVGGADATTISGETVEQVFGDGVMCGDKAVLEVSSCVLRNNERAGVFYLEAGGRVSQNTIVGNGSYGLAMDQCEAEVTYENEANHVFGNAFELPPNQAQQITGTPGELIAPNMPTVMPL